MEGKKKGNTLTASAALRLFQLKRRRNVNVLIFVQVLQKGGGIAHYSNPLAVFLYKICDM